VTTLSTVSRHSSACRRLRVLAVIPTFNEEGKIGRVIGKIPSGTVDGIVVVDDFSTDATAAEARAGGAVVLSHDRNCGVGAAIRTGIDHAIANGFDVVVVLSGDDQHVPSELPGVLAPVLDGRCDMVQGSRRLRGGGTVDMNLFRRVTTAVYAAVFRLLTGFPCTDATNGFRAFRISMFDDRRINLWQDWLDKYELEPYLLYSAVTTGKTVIEVPITIVYHDKGTSKMRPFRDWWRIFRPMVFLQLGICR